MDNDWKDKDSELKDRRSNKAGGKKNRIDVKKNNKGDNKHGDELYRNQNGFRIN